MPFDPNVQKKLMGHKVKPVTVKDKLTNRELRSLNLLSIARKFKPQQAKALKVMLDLLNVSEAPSVQLSSARFVIDFYMELVKSLYKERYDEDKGEDVQPLLKVYDPTNVVQIPDKEEEPEVESSNRRLREKQLLMLSRKLKPHIRRALDTINNLIENAETPPAVKFSASRYMLTTGKSLTESIYHDKYDEEDTQAEEDNAPVFSLRMIPSK